MPPFLVPLLGKLIDGIAGAFGLDLSSDENKIKRAELELEYARLISEQMNAQTEVNKAEASSGDKFASRWRPLIGYICGIAFGYHYIIQPILVFIYTITTGHVPVLPVFDMNALETVLMGMLGLGVMRTYEKTKK